MIDVNKSQAVFLRICELKAEVWDLPPYDEKQFMAALREVRDNLRADIWNLLELATRLLHDAGVALVVEPHTENSRLYGATFWPRPDKAILALTQRFQIFDRFWFSFFHQAGHIVQHPGQRFLETGKGGLLQEDEADTFARKILISGHDYHALTASPPQNSKELMAVSETCDLPEDCLIGLLQHDGIIPGTRFRQWKRRL